MARTEQERLRLETVACSGYHSLAMPSLACYVLDTSPFSSVSSHHCSSCLEAMICA